MTMLSLAWRSLWNRRATAILVVLSIALSVILLLGVERLREQARGSFANTISGVDLVVGSRTGPINLLLYSVFRLGEPTANVSWQAYQHFADDRRVAWTIPLSLGDSHRGYPVLATNQDYFEYFRYGRSERLRLAEGEIFDDVYDAVLGARVARALGYSLGEEIVLAHGMGAVSLTQHDDKPFRVVGILEPTGTPVDNSVHISLQGFQAMHVDWRGGAPIPGLSISAERAAQMSLQPRSITAFMVGLESRVAVFGLQRDINTWRDEPLLAILPGLTLQQLWDLLAVAENALLAVSVLVLLVALLVMLTALLTGLNERRREMAILRAMGARPRQIFALIIGESTLLSALGILLGVFLMQGMTLAASGWLSLQLGMRISAWPPSSTEIWLLGVVLFGGILAGLWPAWRASRNALQDGMSQRL